jgi:hypothetical protein
VRRGCGSRRAANENVQWAAAAAAAFGVRIAENEIVVASLA